jgi:hypothetical protein
MSVFSRYLVLASAFVLALPPGWCCVRPALAAESRAEPAPAPARACCHCAVPEQGPQKSVPTKPSIPSKPCCEVGNGTIVTSPEKPLNPLVADITTVAPGLDNAFDEQVAVLCTAPASSLPLHLLNCLWLC